MDTPAGDTVFDLARGGQLADRYPELPPMLAALSTEDLARAGRLLARLDPDAVRRLHPGVAVLTVAVTGHGTLPGLMASVTVELARHGILTRPFLGEFDSYVFELGDPASGLYAAEPDLVLLMLDPMIVFDEVPVPWTPRDVERVLAEKLTVLRRLVSRFHASGRGTLVVNTVPLPGRFTAQLVDHRSRAELGAVWRTANTKLLELVAKVPALIVLDIDPLVAEGIPVSDPRLSVYAKAHLSGALLARYAREVGHIARALTGRTDKVLAVDLDGTVWGGVLGDDGIDGIEVAGSYAGEAFRAFQGVLKQLASQGVLLAAVSKNDLDPVRTALRDKEGMTLTEDDFVRVVANWRPKHGNLVELAAALNVGLDSIVFLDDSPYECGLVRRELPGVTVVQVDAEPALHVDALLRDGWFDVREVTAEDRTRVAKYQQEVVRKDFLDSFDSVEDYLRELSVTVRLATVNEAEVARVSQLTLRTNQFNLTTVRLQPADVLGLLGSPDVEVLAVRSADRFGDNGLVGVLVLRRRAAAVHLENFLLSCRVFSRGIEHACLAAVLRHARSSGAGSVAASYRRSEKNAMVRDLYPRYGFTPVSDDGTTATFRHDLAALVTVPEHITMTTDLDER